MKKNYSDNDLIKILGTASVQNEVIDIRIRETLESIRQGKAETVGKEEKADRKRTASAREKQPHRRKHKARRKIAYGLGTVAAVVFVSVGICVANPSLAANIPILGNIFTKVQEVFPFGKMPEDETKKLYEDKSVESAADNSGESAQDEGFIYQDQYNGITITFTEYYASNQAIFFGVCIESEEAFPAFAVMGDTDYQLIQANTKEQYSFRNTEVGGVRNIEGRLEDAHTFAGIMRVDYDSINIDDSKYEAACREAEEKDEELPAVTEETWDLYMDRYEVPETFEVQIKIESLRGYCREEIDAENGNQYKVSGSWEFSPCRIEKSIADIQTIQVGKVNEQGIGLDMIEISPVELTLHTIEPANRLTFAVALDKEGKKLASGSSNAYELATTGHDISTVTVYICDYNEYMDEIKAYALEDDKKFRNMLEERALFKTVVDTQKNY
ncbi:MAG: DUF4179 domain-containing protein [Lachnospiraceae bacterium]|nr:DUF4179 domain-containing protein [Lachnospiraceae bacterium]